MHYIIEYYKGISIMVLRIVLNLKFIFIKSEDFLFINVFILLLYIYSSVFIIKSQLELVIYSNPFTIITFNHIFIQLLFIISHSSNPLIFSRIDCSFHMLKVLLYLTNSHEVSSFLLSVVFLIQPRRIQASYSLINYFIIV